MHKSKFVDICKAQTHDTNLKGYCTVFPHALKSLEIAACVLSERMSKTARKNTKGLKSYKEYKS